MENECTTSDFHQGLKEYKEGRNKSVSDFPCGTVGKNLPDSARDTGSISGPGRLHILQSN